MLQQHQLSSGKEGKFQELDDDMKNLQQLMNKVKRIYLEHTNIPFFELNEILQHDLWLDAETCKKYVVQLPKCRGGRLLGSISSRFL